MVPYVHSQLPPSVQCQVQSMQDEIEKYRRNSSVEIPDTIFVMNAYDKPLCLAGACAAPIFSYNKPWFPPEEQRAKREQQLQSQQRRRAAAVRSMVEGRIGHSARIGGLQETEDEEGELEALAPVDTVLLGPLMVYDDVLFPVLNHPFDQVVYFPWENKTHVAMMRAGIYPAMDARCSRVK